MAFKMDLNDLKYCEICNTCNCLFYSGTEIILNSQRICNNCKRNLVK